MFFNHRLFTMVSFTTASFTTASFRTDFVKTDSLRAANIKNYPGQSNGFTLLEILVVLVIVGLLSTLLMQGFAYTLNLRAKVLKQLGRVQNLELVETWFRKTTSNFALREKDPWDPIYFAGTSTRLTAETLFSLDQPMGIMTAIEWRIESDSDGYKRLFYQGKNSNFAFSSDKNQPNNGWQVAEWLATEVSFSYLDKNGEWHNRWPIEEFHDQLPTGIMLSINDDIQPFFWYSRILGQKTAPSIFRP